jgi:glycosyltransferase involved in cell wall biosynthesis
MNMSGKIRLLFLEYFPFMGGGQEVLLGIIEYLKDFFDVEVLIFNKGLIEKRLKKLGVKTHHIQAPDKIKYRYIGKSLPFQLKLNEFLKNGNYSLVYSGGMNAVKLAGPACFTQGIPIIWHKQIIIEKGYFSYNASQARFLSKFVSRIICVSNAAKDSMIKSGVNPSKLVVVHNGVKIPEKSVYKNRSRIRKKYGLEKSFVCGTVCIFRKNKGIEMLQEAAAIIQNKKLPVKFLLAGRADAGQEWYEEELRSNAKNRALNNFIFTGYGDKNLFMPAFDLYIMPSPNEPFGLVTIEAFALGIPAAGFNAGGTKEIITDNFDGMLVNETSAKALAEKIEFAYHNRGKLKAMGKKALKTAEKRFGLNRQMQEIKAIVEEGLEDEY